MNLKEILAKNPADLTDEEKTFLNTNVSLLSDEDKVKFADCLDDEKSLSVEEVKALLSKEATEIFSKKVEGIAEQLVAKFMDGVKDARSKAIETSAKKIEGQDTTRAFMKALVSGDRIAAKALTTSDSGSDPDDAQAGLLIPVELRNEVLRIAQTQYGIARRDMLYLPFSGPGNSRTIPTLGTSVSVFWTGEGAKKRSTQPSFSLVTQTLKKLAAIVPMTEEILEDSLINLNTLLGQLFAEAIAKEEDIQFFNGVGSPWTGILNNGQVNSINQASGDATQLTADDLLDMIDATPTGALNGAKFYMHRSVFSVIRKLKDVNGNYIVQAPTATLPGTIWNHPYELSDAFPALTDVTTGDAYVLFGNLKQGAIFGDKQSIRIKLLDQATVGDTNGAESGSDAQTSINLAEQDMVALRIVERVGYVVALPGALTVLKASATES
ncbi:MAG: phage major capsid protein [Minisyncoccia bacterium]